VFQLLEPKTLRAAFGGRASGACSEEATNERVLGSTGFPAHRCLSEKMGPDLRNASPTETVALPLALVQDFILIGLGKLVKFF
jgi:hypothetical protein